MRQRLRIYSRLLIPAHTSSIVCIPNDTATEQKSPSPLTGIRQCSLAIDRVIVNTKIPSPPRPLPSSLQEKLYSEVTAVAVAAEACSANSAPKID